MGAGKSTRRLNTNVCVHKEDGQDYWFGPDYDGGKVPKDMVALIENPDVWVDVEDGDDTGSGDGGSVAASLYGEMKNAELLAEIDSRNFGRSDELKIVPDSKNKNAYVAALVADDAVDTALSE